MSLYDQLSSIAPAFTGPWRILGYGLLAAPVAAMLWVLLGRRWRPDGVLRCVRCAHPFDPSTTFDGTSSPRCAECGAVTSSAHDALRRRGRKPFAVACVALAALLATPYLLWHSVHVFVARTLLPRWVTSQRTVFPDGLVLVEEVDPVQAWLGFEPNPDPNAWRGCFDDESPTPVGQPGPGTLTWPDRVRIRAYVLDGGPQAMSSLGPFCFGADAAVRMPAAGAPGFGGDLDGDGAPDVVVGEVNVGSGGGISWFRVRRPGDPASGRGVVEFEPIGFGSFEVDPKRGDWVFRRTCHGFRYAVTPGAYAVDPAITCTLDRVRGWVPNADRMVRAADRDRLASLASDAAELYGGCRDAAAEVDAEGGVDAAAPDSAAAALQAFRRGQAGMEEYLPCPEVVGTLLVGVLELVISGNGAEWEQWVRASWPPSAAASFRDAFIADVRRALDSCECARFLRELNGLPEPAPATDTSPGLGGGKQ